jgi:hypothetical protein
MKKSTIAAAAAAIALSGAAGAHEFACEKTVGGAVVQVVETYPATLQFKVIVTNTHPEDASTAFAVRDDVLASLGVSLPQVPFTLEVGQSAEFTATVTVRNEAECFRLARAQACTASFEDTFQVIFDGGVAQCSAQVVCLREERGAGEN